MSVERGGGLDELEPLWLALHEHHAALAGAATPVRDPADSWRRRRAQYERWLEGGDATLLVARDAGGGRAVGYAMLTVGDGGMATWDLGERVADLRTLVVAPEARGSGAGRALVDAARDAARERGAGALFVDVLGANAGALRFYEGAGLRPFYETLFERL